jgi:putative membrane protein
MQDIDILSTVNAVLNTISAVLLITGYIQIRKQQPAVHKKFMFSALIVSALFLISYVVYHHYVGSVPYPYYNWTRPIYFIILIPHIILAGLMTPFVIITVWLAFRKKFEIHRRFARWVFPVWLFVSVSGVLVYLMLYHL